MDMSSPNDQNGNLIAAVDPNGIITRTYYDANNRPVTVVQNLVGQAIEVGTPPAYDPNFPDRNVLMQTMYDAVGNVIATIDPNGIITRTYYDANNQPVTVVQNLVGQTVENPMPPAFNPAYPDRNVRTDTVYDPSGNIIATIDSNGVITRTYYDPLNRPETVVQNLVGQAIGVEAPTVYNPAYPDLNVRTDYVYDRVGNTIAVIDPMGRITRTYYDANHRPVITVQNLTNQPIEDPNPPVYNPAYPDQNVRAETVYDGSGRALATVDPRGVITRTFYDLLDRPTVIVQNLVGQPVENPAPPAYNPGHPDQNVRSESVYDQNGDAIATTANDGAITRTYYDQLHRAVFVVQNLTGQSIPDSTPPVYDPNFPDRNVRTETTFDEAGNVVRTVGANGLVAHSCYDGLGRVIKTVENPTVSDPCGSYVPSQDSDRDITVVYTYDAAGNRLTVQDPNGKESRFQYDALNRLISETDSLQHLTSYTYDGTGNRLTQTDARNIVTRYEYDALNRLTAIVENYRSGVTPNQETNVRTEYSYDAMGNRLTIKDALNHVTTFAYDGLNRPVSERDPLDHVTAYGYDAAGNRVTLLDANGASTSYAYDALNRLAAIDYPAPDADVSFTYDAAGNHSAMSDMLGSTSWSYDGLGRTLSVTDPFSGTMGYRYDALGNRTGLVYPDGKNVLYTYDPLNRLEQVRDWTAQITSYTYDPSGRLAMTILPNAVNSSSAYDGAGRRLTLAHSAGAEVLSSYQYTYDEVGNRTNAVEVVSQPASTPIPTSTDTPVPTATFTYTPTTTGTSSQTPTQTPTSTETPTPTATAPAGTGTLLSEDFNRENSGTVGNGWVEMETMGAAVALQGNRMCYVDTSDVVNRPIVQHAFPQVSSGLVVWTYDFDWSRTGNEGTYRLFMQLGDGTIMSDSNQDAGVGVNLEWTAINNANEQLGYRAGGVVTGLATLSGASQVRVEADLNTQTYNVSVNGIVVGSSLPFDLNVNLNTVRIFTDSLNEENFSGRCFDNLSIAAAIPGTATPTLTATSTATDTPTPTLTSTPTSTTTQTSTSLLFMDDFNRADSGSLGNGWVEVETAGAVSIQGSRMFFADTSDPGSGPFVAHAFPRVTLGQVSWTYDFDWARTGSEGTYRLFMQLGDGASMSDASPDAGVGVNLVWTGDLGTHEQLGYRQAGVVTGITTLSGSNQVRVDADLNSHTYRVSVNGVLVGSGLPFDQNVSLDTVRIFTDALNEVNFSGRGFDNLSVSAPDTTSTPTSTPTATGPAVTPTPTQTPTLTPTGNASDVIFADGFESGSFSAWTSSVTDSGDLSVSTQAALNGSYGMQALVDSNAGIYVQDDSPSAESRYRARFDFDPNSISMANNNYFAILVGRTDTADVFRIELYYSTTSGYKLRYAVKQDGSSAYTNGTSFAISDAPHTVEFDWLAATAAEANNGEVTFWIDGVQVSHRTDFDTDTQRIDQVRLGAVTGLVDNIRGTLYFDRFESRRQTYIGLVTRQAYSGLLQEAESGQICGTFLNCLSNFLELGWLKAPLASVFFGGSNFQVDVPYRTNHALMGNVKGEESIFDRIVQALSKILAPDSLKNKAASSTPEFAQSVNRSPDIIALTHFELQPMINAPLALETPGQVMTTTITYTYDPLNRLTAATYNDGTTFRYTYDAVGNRLSEETAGGTVIHYTYDSANRLTSVDGVPYTWDNNGNLLSDGLYTYTYDHANRLISVSGPGATVSYAYNGLGDRLQETVSGVTTRFTMDLNQDLTQVLADGTHTYLYGNSRIAQYGAAGSEYFLDDALGSVRQMMDAAGAVSMSKAYQPYGEVLNSYGSASSNYGYTGEWTTPANQGNLVYLRARWYTPGQGRFLTPDPFRGFPFRPRSLHRYSYAENNPVNFTDPAGLITGLPPFTAPIPGHVMSLVRSVSGRCGLTGQFSNIMGGIAQYFDNITLGESSAVDVELVKRRSSGRLWVWIRKLGCVSDCGW